MGERRWRASQAPGSAVIPAIIKDTSDDDLLRDALLENLHRSQLNPLEEAAAYQQLLDDFGCSHEELATRIGRSRPQISNTLRLLKLPPLVQRRVAAGVLSAGHARALLGMADGAAMERMAQRIVAEGLSVRNVEELVVARRGQRRPQGAPPPRREPPPAARRLHDRPLRPPRDARRIALGQRKGKITVEFASVEDLRRILGLMGVPASAGLRPRHVRLRAAIPTGCSTERTAVPEGHTIHALADRLERAFGGHEVEATSPQGRFAADAEPAGRPGLRAGAGAGASTSSWSSATRRCTCTSASSACFP